MAHICSLFSRRLCESRKSVVCLPNVSILRYNRFFLIQYLLFLSILLGTSKYLVVQNCSIKNNGGTYEELYVNMFWAFLFVNI